MTEPTFIPPDDKTYNAKNTIDMIQKGGVYVPTRKEITSQMIEDSSRRGCAGLNAQVMAGEDWWKNTKRISGINFLFEAAYHLSHETIGDAAIDTAVHGGLIGALIGVTTYAATYAVAYGGVSKKYDTVKHEAVNQFLTNGRAEPKTLQAIAHKAKLYGLMAGALTMITVGAFHRNDLGNKKQPAKAIPAKAQTQNGFPANAYVMR